MEILLMQCGGVLWTAKIGQKSKWGGYTIVKLDEPWTRMTNLSPISAGWWQLIGTFPHFNVRMSKRTIKKC